MKLFLLLLLAVSTAFGAEPVTSGTALPTQATGPGVPFPRYPQFNLVCVGDSHTDSQTLGVRCDLMYPELLGRNLRDLGCPVMVHNQGVNGDTSSNMCNRAVRINRYGKVDLFIIWAGANDQNQGFSTNYLTTNLICLSHCAMFGAVGVVDTEASLPSGKKAGTRYVVRTDGASNPGAASFGGLAANVGTTGASAAGNVWECRNLNASTNGWGRIATTATTPTHCSKVIIQGMQYLNYSSGGDNGATSSSYPGLREAQQTAVTTINGGGTWAVYNDNYAQFYALITSGQETQGSANTQIADANSHHNPKGNAYIAQFATTKISNQSGWIAALK